MSRIHNSLLSIPYLANMISSSSAKSILWVSMAISWVSFQQVLGSPIISKQNFLGSRTMVSVTEIEASQQKRGSRGRSRLNQSGCFLTASFCSDESFLWPVYLQQCNSLFEGYLVIPAKTCIWQALKLFHVFSCVYISSYPSTGGP